MIIYIVEEKLNTLSQVEFACHHAASENVKLELLWVKNYIEKEY